MRSSPAYAGLVLELPPVTLADRIAAVLVAVAGAHGAAVLAGQGATTAAAVVVCASALVVVGQAAGWTRTGRRAPLRLERRPDGSLRVRTAAGYAVPAWLGTGTRRVGSTVFLDVRLAIDGRPARYRRWLTRFDLPRAELRRWSVVLPGSGRAACS